MRRTSLLRSLPLAFAALSLAVTAGCGRNEAEACAPTTDLPDILAESNHELEVEQGKRDGVTIDLERFRRPTIVGDRSGPANIELSFFAELVIEEDVGNVPRGELLAADYGHLRVDLVTPDGAVVTETVPVSLNVFETSLIVVAMGELSWLGFTSCAEVSCVERPQLSVHWVPGESLVANSLPVSVHLRATPVLSESDIDGEASTPPAMSMGVEATP